MANGAAAEEEAAATEATSVWLSDMAGLLETRRERVREKERVCEERVLCVLCGWCCWALTRKVETAALRRTRDWDPYADRTPLRPLTLSSSGLQMVKRECNKRGIIYIVVSSHSQAAIS